MVVNIVANIVLIPLWGMMGCAIACFISYLVRSLMAMIISMIKNKEIRYHYVRIYFITAIMFIISMANWIMPNTNIFVSLLLKILFILIFSIAFYLPNKKTVSLLVSRYRQTKKN